jgi:Mg-chelatase subunit ChlI
MDKDQRVQMVLDRMAYEADPDAFVASAAEEQAALQVSAAIRI